MPDVRGGRYEALDGMPERVEIGAVETEPPKVFFPLVLVPDDEGRHSESLTFGYGRIAAQFSSRDRLRARSICASDSFSVETKALPYGVSSPIFAACQPDDC